MSDIHEYLNNISPEQRAQYDRVKKIAQQLVPDIDEVISYGIPTIKYKGKYLIYFGAFPNHMSLYPIPTDEIRKKLKDFKLGKGTIQFTAEKPVPEEIIKEMVLHRFKQISKG